MKIENLLCGDVEVIIAALESCVDGEGPMLSESAVSNIRIALEKVRKFSADAPGPNDGLEAEAVALVTKYKAMLMIAPPVKAFFKRLAVFLKWSDLEKAL